MECFLSHLFWLPAFLQQLLTKRSNRTRLTNNTGNFQQHCNMGFNQGQELVKLLPRIANSQVCAQVSARNKVLKCQTSLA